MTEKKKKKSGDVFGKYGSDEGECAGKYVVFGEF
jgi:hypothetical protein